MHNDNKYIRNIKSYIRNNDKYILRYMEEIIIDNVIKRIVNLRTNVYFSM